MLRFKKQGGGQSLLIENTYHFNWGEEKSSSKWAQFNTYIYLKVIVI